MIAKSVFRKTIVAMAISLVCLAAINADAQVNTSKRSDGSSVSSTMPATGRFVPDARPATAPAGVTLIYSSFGPKGAIYDASTGWTEAGAEANDFPIAEAMSFVPASDVVLLRVDAAFTYVTGTNGAHLILAEDKGGVPGKIIYGASFTNLPTFGTCCTVQTVKLTPTKTSHVALKGGATYWIYPLPDDTTGYIVWNLGVATIGGNGAVSNDYGKTWTASPFDTFGAFDLYGSVIAE
jgi:hypothetical protein